MVAAVTARSSQLGIMLVLNFPSEEGQVSTLGPMAVLESAPDVRVSQIGCMVVFRGRVADPRLIVWKFKLDSHEFYVLRLGDNDTLVYDTYSKKWSNWGSATSTRWRAKTGRVWQGAGAAAGGYGTAIIVGDEAFGTLYFLDPEYPYDDHPETGATNAALFHRIVQGQISHRGRDPIDCFGVSLTGSFGDIYASSLTDVSLSYSDDAGRTYEDAGTISVVEGDFAARVEWPSLGMIFAPGRLFKIEDDGSLARIDNLELLDAES